MNPTSTEAASAATPAHHLSATEGPPSASANAHGAVPPSGGATRVLRGMRGGKRAWRLRFSGRYALAALAIFLIEAAIATVGNHIEWLRWYAGDVIVIGFVHCLLATVVEASTVRVALASFAVGCAVEVSQYVAHVMGWMIGNPILRIIVGSTADWMDVLSYALGTVLILAISGLHGLWNRR